jgi:hypothetical protein
MAQTSGTRYSTTAVRGDVVAQLLHGLTTWAQGCGRDPQSQENRRWTRKGIECIRNAYTQGYLEAGLFLARCLLDENPGNTVRDSDQATALLRELDAIGCTDAGLALYGLDAWNSLLSPDPKDLVAAEKGDATAQWLYGQRAWFHGCAEDPSSEENKQWIREGIKRMRKAYEQGCSEAGFTLACCLSNPIPAIPLWTGKKRQRCAVNL